MKIITTLCLVLTTFTINTNAQNLIDLQDWKAGTGGTSNLGQNGSASQNIREWGEGPGGIRALLWKAVPDGGVDRDGGWNSSAIPIDNKLMYRSVIWMKKTNSNDGHSYFGCLDVASLDGIPYSNPYFWYGDLPELNKWYLLVGYIHASDDPSTVNYGGIYDGITGQKVVEMNDFKFSPTATETVHRTYLFYDPNVNDRQYFYNPRLEVVNGNEPTIASLLGLTGQSLGPDIFAQRIGVKTTNLGEFDLAVNGKIRSREIKVENGNWADYVFEEGYKITSLPELEKYIKANKHLPDMPTAKEVEVDGIELSKMNALLLKNQEELTLRLIRQNKDMADLTEQLRLQNKKINKLKARLK